MSRPSAFKEIFATLINNRQSGIITMSQPSAFKEIPFGAAKLCQDFATLVNNRRGSDIQFKVGGGIKYNQSSIVTLYAHSLILRCRSDYFAAMLDKDKSWKESSDGIIYKPNTSASTFQEVLHYIYTGNVCTKSSENIIELITAADEMDLKELSSECQAELIRIVRNIFYDKEDKDKESTRQQIPIDVAIRRYIIPALNLASNQSLPDLAQKLQAAILPHMSVIIKSPDAYREFIDGISAEAITYVIASHNLAIAERSVWDLALSWACHQVELSKTAVEAHLSNAKDDEDDRELLDESPISFSQLNLLKETLAPLLPLIRFSLFDPEDYVNMTHILSYFLPRYRFSELAPLIYKHNGTKLPDTPRQEIHEPKIYSKIMIDSTLSEYLEKKIFATGGITGCLSLNDLKVELLFRASEHGFLATTFHERCDYQGPTLVLVKSVDGHLFGGVNFNDWESDSSYSSSSLNFLFALPDGRHRTNTAIFRIKNQDTTAQYSSCNDPNNGPTFGGGYDLHIADNAGVKRKSYSGMPHSYAGKKASNDALAGSRNFKVLDYEVFAISKKKLSFFSKNFKAL